MVNLSDPLNVAFSQNCTSALNLAILGSVKRRGFHVITSVHEHNSVLRPLFELRQRGIISLSVLAPDRENRLTAQRRSKCLQQGYAAGCFKPRKQRGRFRKRRRFNRRPVQAGGRNFYRGRGAIRRLHRNRYAADENRPVGFPGAQGTARHSGLRLPLLQ